MFIRVHNSKAGGKSVTINTAHIVAISENKIYLDTCLEPKLQSNGVPINAIIHTDEDENELNRKIAEANTSE